MNKTYKEEEDEAEVVVLTLYSPAHGEIESSRKIICLEFENAEEAAVILRSVASQFNQ